MLEFVLNNWYLFLALAVVLALLLAGPLTRLIHGIQVLGPNQAVLLVNRENGVLVDVCEPNEYREGHIPRAINIPLSQLEERVKELEKYKDRPVVLCCRSGNRSLKAATRLKRHGFAKVYSLAGGLLAWQRENLPVEK
jgi:rhodanese-related sulfurtransferase